MNEHTVITLQQPHSTPSGQLFYAIDRYELQSQSLQIKIYCFLPTYSIFKTFHSKYFDEICSLKTIVIQWTKGYGVKIPDYSLISSDRIGSRRAWQSKLFNYWFGWKSFWNFTFPQNRLTGHNLKAHVNINQSYYFTNMLVQHTIINTILLPSVSFV